ncbi:MAG: two-component regulator propeller domain-containing protein [Bacteroidia bacterium]
MKTIRLLIIITCLAFCYQVKAQLALGEWRVHLSYNATIAVAELNNRMYAASRDAVYYFDKDDNSVTGMSKVSGLSDFGVTAMNSNPYNNVVVIAYTSSNIDLIKNGKIINLSDIKRKTILGDKSIHSISFYKQFAYISCGFGIVVIDTEREEVKETYYLGPGGTSLDIFGTTADGTYLYAAAEDGVYMASLNDPFIVNSANWTKTLSAVANSGPFNLIAAFAGKIIVSHDLSGDDSLYYYYNNSWTALPHVYSYHSIKPKGNELIVSSTYNAIFFDTNLTFTGYVSANEIPNLNCNDAIKDNSGTLWFADNVQGMIKYNSTSDYESIFPNGPKSPKTAIVKIVNDDLWVGHAIRNNNWQPAYSTSGFSNFSAGTWQTFDGAAPNNPNLKISDVWDLVATAVDPNNSKHVYFGSWGRGLLESNNGDIFLFDASNSILHGNQFGAVRVGGLAFDNNSNLWITNSENDSCLRVRFANGNWKSYKSKIIDPSSIIADILVDDYNQKWINVYRKGILVFNDNNTPDNLNDDKWRFLNDQAGSGNLASPSVFCMTKDKDGQIWMGTEKGVCVFYAPGSIYSTSNSDAQKILIQQDGYYQYLLEKEFVTAIAIDGANRKWIGTQSGGVFLMSADGTTQISNFNEDNSPLLSNTIISIDINATTGEVFFGTDRGVCSYKGDAIEGGEGCSNVYVYPNPIRETYEGPIAITGLVNNGRVKITDVSGHLVYETNALGGQAIWDGRKFDGNRAHTGVYLVLCSDDDGTNTCITKMLLISSK